MVLCQFNTLAQVVSAALGGGKPAPARDIVEESGSAEEAVMAINRMMAGN